MQELQELPSKSLENPHDLEIWFRVASEIWRTMPKAGSEISQLPRDITGSIAGSNVEV